MFAEFNFQGATELTAAGGRGRELLQMGGGDLPQYQQATPHKLLQMGEGDTVGARSTMPIPIACYCLPCHNCNPMARARHCVFPPPGITMEHDQ